MNEPELPEAVLFDLDGTLVDSERENVESVVLAARRYGVELTEDEEATKVDFMVFLTMQTMNYLHSGRHRVAL